MGARPRPPAAVVSKRTLSPLIGPPTRFGRALPNELPQGDYWAYEREGSWWLDAAVVSLYLVIRDDQLAIIDAYYKAPWDDQATSLFELSESRRFESPDFEKYCRTE